MQNDVYKRYCDVLEVSPDASMAEIEKSYLYLKELYSTDTIASIPLEDEFSQSDREEILSKIDDAYHGLMVLLKQEKNFPESETRRSADDKEVLDLVSEIEVFGGPALRQVREKMGIRLEDIAGATRIQTEHLSNLEAEDFNRLPAEVYTRGFVASYAESLSLDPGRVVDDYMRRYGEWKKDHRKGSVASLFSMFRSRK